LEQVAIDWLKELFGLPAEMGGVLTTGATMANFVALGCARRWCALREDVDADADGLAGAPPITVLGGGYTHPSDVKVMGMLGVGRERVRKLARDDVGRVDLEAMEAALRELGGRPAIVIGSAGEVNAGDFDPLAAMADLASRYGAWFHVDGAFGLFAAVSPRTRHLVEGVERADSVIADGHKWLNVLRERSAHPELHYLAPVPPDIDNLRPKAAARSLPVEDGAYGREGHRDRGGDRPRGGAGRGDRRGAGWPQGRRHAGRIRGRPTTELADRRGATGRSLGLWCHARQGREGRGSHSQRSRQSGRSRGRDCPARRPPR
jgi:hypothetical protein